MNKERFKALLVVVGAPLLLLLLLLLLVAPTKLVIADETKPVMEEDCQTFLDQNAYLFEHPSNVTLLKTEPKVAKVYPRLGSPARRRGLGKLITTLFSVHSREAVPFFENDPPTKGVLDDIFRCRGFGTKKRLDQELVDTVIAAATEFESERVEIISAYRSVKFNDTLAKKGRRVAAESKHTQGRAIDFRLTNVSAAKLGEWLWDNFDGGIGTYRGDNFVHIDTGFKRRWRGR